MIENIECVHELGLQVGIATRWNEREIPTTSTPIENSVPSLLYELLKLDGQSLGVRSFIAYDGKDSPHPEGEKYDEEFGETHAED